MLFWVLIGRGPGGLAVQESPDSSQKCSASLRQCKASLLTVGMGLRDQCRPIMFMFMLMYNRKTRGLALGTYCICFGFRPDVGRGPRKVRMLEVFVILA